jgi:hypothetical protein
MSDTATHDAASASPEEPLFSPVEIEQFSADDVVAGSAIGKMLSALFLYTIFAMCIAGWWTFSSITADKGNSSASEAADHSGDHTHATEEAAH